jgi:putative membrane protein
VRFLKRLIAFLLLALVLIFGMLFAVQNTSTVPLYLLIVQFEEQRVSIWLLLAFVLGGLIGVLVSSVAIVRLKSQLMLLNRKLEKSEKALVKTRIEES